MRRLSTPLSLAVGGIGLWLSWQSLPTEPAKLEVTEVASFDVLGLTKSLAQTYGLPLRVIWDDRISGLEPPKYLPVESLYIQWVRIQNTGEQAFEWNADIEEPLRFSLTGKGRVFSVGSSVRIKSDNSIVSLTELDRENSFRLQTNFIPAKAYFIFDVIHSGDSKALSVSGRLKRQSALVLARNASGAALANRDAVWNTIATPASLAGLILSAVALVWRRRNLKERWLVSVNEANCRGIAPSVIASLSIWVLFRLAGTAAGQCASLFAAIHICAFVGLVWGLPRLLGKLQNRAGSTLGLTQSR